MTLRVLIAVTHLLGAGHLTRAAALARAFERAGHQVTLVSGGMPARLVAFDGALVQLPPLRVQGTNFTTLLDQHEAPATDALMAERRNMLLHVLRQAQPDVLVTELFPFGRRILADEFLALLTEADRLFPRCLVLASIRDILASPSKPARAEETHQRLGRHYDAVLVHSDPELVPLEASWPMDDHTADMIRYTGYVDDIGPIPEQPERREIVVSGGSSAEGLPIYRAAAAAARHLPDYKWRILLGGGVPDAELTELQRTVPANAVVERARADFRLLLSGAALSISQAGYNTVVDLLRTRARRILVPFEAGHETEQRMRAERLAARGLAELLPGPALSGDILASRVAELLLKPRPEIAPMDLDGARRSVRIVEELASEKLS